MSDPELEDLDEQAPKPEQVLCAFYGDNSYEWIDEKKLVLLEEGMTKFGQTAAVKRALTEAMADAE